MTKVQVTQGLLEGEHLETLTGDTKYYSFKGIPYAEPPLGKLRFKAPRPPSPWEGVRKATEHGLPCPQIDTVTNELILGSEDCLYLNVYTPDLTPKTPKTVIFFIHGGGYKSGSGDDNNYGPDFLVAHDVVLVTFTYRVEAFGFLCLDTADVPGNAGLKDQVAALRWVNENISNFGGDPNNITIMGESAGGATVIYHMVSPLSKGLFKRGISMSGAPNCDWSLAYQPRRRAFTLGKHLGIDTQDDVELLNYLQSLPSEKLIGSNPCVITSEERCSNNSLKMYHFTPVIEKNLGTGNFLTEDPMDAINNGRVNKADILMGHTNEESLLGIQLFESIVIDMYKMYPELFVPRKITVKATPDVILELSDRIIKHYFGDKKLNVEAMREFVTYANESSLYYDIYRLINSMLLIGGTQKYVYKFSVVSDRSVYGKQGLKHGLTGASHLDDLMYLFNAKKFGLELKKGTKEYELVQFVCKIFTNFAKYGNPTPDKSLGVIWPEYNNSTKSYGEITDTITIRQNLGADMLKFWKSIYEYAGIEF